MSAVTKKQTSYAKFLTVQLDKNRYTALKIIFIVALVISWVFLIINIIDLLGEIALGSAFGGGMTDIMAAVHFQSVIWGVIVVAIIGILNLMLRRTK